MTSEKITEAMPTSSDSRVRVEQRREDVAALLSVDPSGRSCRAAPACIGSVKPSIQVELGRIERVLRCQHIGHERRRDDQQRQHRTEDRGSGRLERQPQVAVGDPRAPAGRGAAVGGGRQAGSCHAPALAARPVRRRGSIRK